MLLLNDESLLQSIGINSREASHKYDVSSTVRKIEGYYEEILR